MCARVCWFALLFFDCSFVLLAFWSDCACMRVYVFQVKALELDPHDAPGCAELGAQARAGSFASLRSQDFYY